MRRPAGWRGDSWRHSLSAKGISSGKKAYFAKFRKGTESRYTEPLFEGRSPDMKLKRIPLDEIEQDWETGPEMGWDPQREQHIASVKELSKEEFREPITVEPKLASKKEVDENPTMRIGVDGYGMPFGDPSKFQLIDGHHRVNAALLRGDKDIVARIPISTEEIRVERKRLGLKIKKGK